MKWKLALMTLALCAAFAFCLPMAGADVLILPEDVTRIEEEAFYGDVSIDAVVLPEGVTYIGPRAFARTSVREIHLPSSLSYIAEDAFSGSPLQRASAPAGSYACSWAQARHLIPPETDAALFTYSSPSGGKVTVTGLADPDSCPSSLVIPALSPDGSRIAAVGESAFEGQSMLTDVVLGANVETVGAKAFKDCVALTGVTLPEGLKSLSGTVNYDYGVFSGCTSLSFVVIPSTLETIGNYAFHNCTSLTTLAFAEGGESALSIGANAFSGSGITGTLVIPSRVSAINAYAFSGTPVSSLKIRGGEHLSAIGESAFSGCASLTDVMIPGNVSTIWANAFKNCENLSVLSLSEGLKTIAGTVNGDNGAFSGCTMLDEVTLPNTLETLGNYAFHNCTFLESLTILDRGDHALSIGANAFSGTRLSGTLILPAKVSAIGASAFQGTPIAALDIQGGENLHAIGEDAFRGCQALVTVSLPGNVATIGARAFQNCPSLTYLSLSEGLKTIAGTVNGNNGAFSGCESLIGVTLPLTVETVGNYAFYNCTNLRYLTIHNSDCQMSIGSYAFCKTGLAGTLIIPSKVKSIGSYSFSETDIRVLDIHDGDSLTTIGESAFRSCASLVSVTLPGNVTTISANAFRSCSALSDLNLSEGLTKILGSVNYNYGAFCDCVSLPSVVLPSTIRTISTYAFYNCQSLATIIIKTSADNVSVGSNAFGKCPGVPVYQ